MQCQAIEEKGQKVSNVLYKIENIQHSDRQTYAVHFMYIFYPERIFSIVIWSTYILCTSFPLTWLVVCSTNKKLLDQLVKATYCYVFTEGYFVIHMYLLSILKILKNKTKRPFSLMGCAKKYYKVDRGSQCIYEPYCRVHSYWENLFNR